MKETYNKKERKTIYLKLATAFENNNIWDDSFTYNFKCYSDNYYNPHLLTKEFPELKLLWFEKRPKNNKHPDLIDFQGFDQFKFKNCEEKDLNKIKATLLYLAYYITE